MQSAARPEGLTDGHFDEMRKENKMEENMVIAPNEEIGVEELDVALAQIKHREEWEQ